MFIPACGGGGGDVAQPQQHTAAAAGTWWCICSCLHSTPKPVPYLSIISI